MNLHLEVAQNMVGLGRVELPTYGLGKHTAILAPSENLGPYSIFQQDFFTDDAG
jgi:hypothetical protein